MESNINNIQTGLHTHHSNKSVSEFSSQTEIIDDEILTYTQNKYGSLVEQLGLDANNMSVADLAQALDNNQNSSLQGEIDDLQEALTNATMELSKQYFLDENLTSQFDEGRETAVNYFELFNKDYDKAQELYNYASEKIPQVTEGSVSKEDTISGNTPQVDNTNYTYQDSKDYESYNEVDNNNNNESKMSFDDVEKFAQTALDMGENAKKTISKNKNVDSNNKTESNKNNSEFYNLETVMSNYSKDNEIFKSARDEVSSLFVNNKLQEGKMTLNGEEVEIKKNNNSWEVIFNNNKSMTLSKKSNGGTGLKITKKSWTTSDKTQINAYYGSASFMSKSGWYVDINNDNKANYIAASGNKNTENGKDIYLGKD